MLRWEGGAASFSGLLEEMALSSPKEWCCRPTGVNWLELVGVGVPLCWGCGEGDELATVCVLELGGRW